MISRCFLVQIPLGICTAENRALFSFPHCRTCHVWAKSHTSGKKKGHDFSGAQSDRKQTKTAARVEGKMAPPPPACPPPLPGEKPQRRTSSIRNLFHVVENSGYGEGVVFFPCVPGGAWGAAGNGGVPVLWGLDGGSGTALCFQSLVCFRAQPA